MTKSKDRRIFIVANRPDGIVIFKTNPNRVSYITHETIVEYENTPGKETDGYAEISATLQRLVLDIDGKPGGMTDQDALGIQIAIHEGFAVSNADFALVGTLNKAFDDDDVVVRRRSYNPIGPVMQDLAKDVEEIVMSDLDPNYVPSGED